MLKRCSKLCSIHRNGAQSGARTETMVCICGSAAEHRIAKMRTAVKLAVGGLPSSVTVQRKSAAPRHLPQGEGKGGCRRRAQNLPKCKPQLSPPGRAALIRHGAAQRRTAPPSPRGKARAAAAAERRYCRCAYRRSFAAGGAKAVFPKGKGFSPHKFVVFVAPGRVFCYNTFNNTQNAQKGLFV